MVASKAELGEFSCQTERFGCVMLITVALDRTSYRYNYTGIYGSEGTLEIEASSELETLRIGEPTIGFT